MRKATTYLICLLLCLLVGASCIDRPEYVLDEDQMVAVLVDVHKAEGLMEMQNYSGNQDVQKSIMAAVLVEHGVSRAQYDSSLMWYARHLRQFIRVYSHVDEKLMAEHDKWSALSTDSKDFVTSESGDSVQLWSMRNYLALDHQRFLGHRFWELESDSNFYRGDTLRWSFDVDHLIEGQSVMASVSFTRDMKERAESMLDPETKERRRYLPVGQITRLITKNGPQVISAVPDSMQRFEKAIISVVLVGGDEEKLKSPVFINNISLIRYHCE